MAEVAEVSLQVCSIEEHQKDLQNYAFVFVASGHFNRPKKYAKLVKRKTGLELHLSEIHGRYPSQDSP